VGNQSDIFIIDLNLVWGWTRECLSLGSALGIVIKYTAKENINLLV